MDRLTGGWFETRQLFFFFPSYYVYISPGKKKKMRNGTFHLSIINNCIYFSSASVCFSPPPSPPLSSSSFGRLERRRVVLHGENAAMFPMVFIPKQHGKQVGGTRRKELYRNVPSSSYSSPFFFFDFLKNKKKRRRRKLRSAAFELDSEEPCWCLSVRPCVLGEYLGGDGDTVNLSITKSWKTGRPPTCFSPLQETTKWGKSDSREREKEKTFYNT